MQEEEERRPTPARDDARHTVDDAATSLRRQLALQGARKSYLEGCESMQRIHLRPALGDRPLEKVTSDDVEALGAAMLRAGRAPKTVRNVLSFPHAVFEHAVARPWVRINPVREASRPKKKRSTDANPDLQFLTVEELDAVVRALPDEISIGQRRQRGAGAEGRRRLRPPMSLDRC